MRKIFKAILTSILCFGLLFSAFACENGSGFNGNSTTRNSQESSSTESDGDSTGGELNEEYVSIGAFYTLEEAYNQGRITREDIMHVCYYAFGKVYEGEKGIAEKDLREIEFQPTVELGSLSENVLADIKQNYYEENKSEFYDRNGNKLGGVENLQIDFFGKYGAAYVVSVNCDLWEYNCSVWVESIDGIAWIEGGAAFLVFQHAE